MEKKSNEALKDLKGNILNEKNLIQHKDRTRAYIKKIVENTVFLEYGNTTHAVGRRYVAENYTLVK